MNSSLEKMYSLQMKVNKKVLREICKSEVQTSSFDKRNNDKAVKLQRQAKSKFLFAQANLLQCVLSVGLENNDMCHNNYTLLPASEECEWTLRDLNSERNWTIKGARQRNDLDRKGSGQQKDLNREGSRQ